jgi:hypothetical protein
MRKVLTNQLLTPDIIGLALTLMIITDNAGTMHDIIDEDVVGLVFEFCM